MPLLPRYNIRDYLSMSHTVLVVMSPVRSMGRLELARVLDGLGELPEENYSVDIHKKYNLPKLFLKNSTRGDQGRVFSVPYRIKVRERSLGELGVVNISKVI